MKILKSQKMIMTRLILFYDKSDLKDSRVEKTEVYDADYRVIVPPPTQSTVSGTSDKSNDKGNDDDWDFLEEDFSEDKPQR